CRPRTGQAERSWVLGDRREAGSSRPPRAQPEQLPGPPHGEPAATRPGQARESRRVEQAVNSATTQWVGIDVSKATLDVCVHPSGAQWQAPNRRAQIEALVEQLAALAAERIVLKASGGYEALLVAALVSRGLL